jgi:hypothetical protein
MKTPIQELIEIIKKRQEDDEAMPFMYNDRIIALAESMLEKEKEMMCEFAEEYVGSCLIDYPKIEVIFNQTFNNKENV